MIPHPVGLYVPQTLDAPTSLTVTLTGAVPSKTLQLAWTDQSVGETAWEIQRRALPGGGFATIATPSTSDGSGTGGGETYDDTDAGKAGDTEYEYRVRATNGGVTSDWSNVDSAYTDADAPAAPSWAATYPKDEPSTSGEVLVSISAVTGADAYEVYYRQNFSMSDPPAQGTLVSLTPAQVESPADYGVTGLSDGQTYYWIARATVTGNSGRQVDGAFGTQVNVDPQEQVPNAPTGVTATAGTSQISVSWTAPVGGGTPDTYDVQRRGRVIGGSFGSYADLSGNTEGTSTTHPDVTIVDDTTLDGNEYQYRVRASNAGGDSAWAESNVECIDVPVALPSITSVSTTGVADPTSELRIVYSATSGGTVEIRYKQDVSGTWLTDQGPDTNGSPFDLTGLADNATYDVQIREVNGCGDQSAWTATTQGTTDLAPPGTVTFNSVTPKAATDDTLTLDWDVEPDATSYDIERSANGVSGWSALVTNYGTGSTDTYDDTGLNADERWYYRIKGRNSAGTSASWSVVRAGRTYITSPAITNQANNDANCSSGGGGDAGITVTVDHDNSSSDTRSEQFEYQYKTAATQAGLTAASYSTSTNVTGGSTSFDILPTVGSTTWFRVRVKYNSEDGTTWTVGNDYESICPI